MLNFLKQIFTWWHRQTFGTFIYTLFMGKYIGSDEFGNKYYTDSKGKRWVIYKDIVEASKIPSEWYLWIHFLSKNKPADNKKKQPPQADPNKVYNIPIGDSFSKGPDDAAITIIEWSDFQ